jgi:hypothetical protein
MTQSNQAIILNVRRAGEIEASGDPASAVDRYLVESSDTSGSVALVEHIVAQRVLAAPLHRHSREDEFSVVLEGRLGVFQTATRWLLRRVTSCSSRADTGTRSGMPGTSRYGYWS